MRSGRVWAPSDDGDVNDDAYANTQKLALVLSGLGFRLQSFEFRVSRFWGFDFSPFFASERCFQLSLAATKNYPSCLVVVAVAVVVAVVVVVGGGGGAAVAAWQCGGVAV